MARKRVRLKDVKTINLEIDAWLLEWALHPEWQLEDFGLYWLMNLLLYKEGGQVEADMEKLATFCRSHPKAFVKTWSRIESKLTLSGRFVSQKRVLNELKAARKRIQSASDAGVKGMKKRWGSNNDLITKRIRNEHDLNFDSKGSDRISDSDISSAQIEAARCVEGLFKIIKPRSQSDRTALAKVCTWGFNQIKAGRHTESLFAEILTIAKESTGGDKPIAVFFSQMRQKLGYNPRAEAQKRK